MKDPNRPLAIGDIVRLRGTKKTSMIVALVGRDHARLDLPLRDSRVWPLFDLERMSRHYYASSDGPTVRARMNRNRRARAAVRKAQRLAARRAQSIREAEEAGREDEGEGEEGGA